MLPIAVELWVAHQWWHVLMILPYITMCGIGVSGKMAKVVVRVAKFKCVGSWNKADHVCMWTLVFSGFLFMVSITLIHFKI